MHWVGKSKSYFEIHYESENPMRCTEFELHCWHGNIENQRGEVPWFSFFRFSFFIRYESENPILTSKILFWHSLWIGKILFWHSKSYCEIRTESENQKPILTFAMDRKNPILTFKILLWDSHWVGKSKFYFYLQNPISTFALSRKILFWHSKSYFHIRYESENLSLTFKILFWHLQCKNSILNVKIWLFLHLADSECQNRILNVNIGFSESVRMSK